MSNATLFIRESIHQGDSRFSDISRGRQCAFMSLSALLWTNSHDISTWTTETIDRVLFEGDAMYLKSFEERSIPDAETIPLNYLPDRVLSFTIRTTSFAMEKHPKLNQLLKLRVIQEFVVRMLQFSKLAVLHFRKKQLVNKIYIKIYSIPL